MHYDTLYEAKFAARYAARAHHLSAKVWGKLASLLAITELLGGSAAFGAYISQSPSLAAATGLILAFCVAINYGINPAKKVWDEERLSKQFMELYGKQNISLNDFNASLGALCSEPAHEIESLRYVAYNDTAQEFGRDEYAFKLTFMQKLFSLV